MLDKSFLKVEVLTFVAFGTLLTLFTSGVQAQPAGSYRQSCSAPVVRGDTLSTTCLDRAGKFRATSLGNISACVGGIFNDDGALRCSRGGTPPPGSYTQTCERQYVANGYLIAVCRNRDGNGVRSAPLLLNGCVGDIYNDNGKLWCSRSAETPSGSYTQSCEQTRVVGEALVSLCRERGGLLRSTSLPKFRQCVGDIFNDNGNLGCRR
jgi:hypothetical protein